MDSMLLPDRAGKRGRYGGGRGFECWRGANRVKEKQFARQVKHALGLDAESMTGIARGNKGKWYRDALTRSCNQGLR